MPTALVGLPYDAASSFLRGPAEAPALIRRALASPASNSWTETGVDLAAPGTLVDRGDVALGDADAEARAAIEHAIAGVLGDGLRPLSLGGDHSVTYPVLRAVRARQPRLTVLHLDAHPDLYDEFEGDRYSHACPFARVMEESLADRLVQVGVRTMNDHQRAQARRFGVEVVEMRQWTGTLDVRIDGPVYVSLDVDVLDPAFAPGVSHVEPGGLSTREVIGVLHALRRRVVGADVVELNPGRDPTGVTAVVAAKLVKELVGIMEGG